MRVGKHVQSKKYGYAVSMTETRSATWFNSKDSAVNESKDGNGTPVPGRPRQSKHAERWTGSALARSATIAETREKNETNKPGGNEVGWPPG